MPNEIAPLPAADASTLAGPAATEPVTIPNLRDLTPTQLAILADWQRDHDPEAARLRRGVSTSTFRHWQDLSLPFQRACSALSNGQRLYGLDTEIVENEMPHILLDALRESRDPINRGADRLGNRRLLAEVGRRVGQGAQVQGGLTINASQVMVLVQEARKAREALAPGTPGVASEAGG